MKKSLLSLATVALASGALVGSVFALDIVDLFQNGVPAVDDAYVKLLNEYGAWWYSDLDVLTCNWKDGSVTIKTPSVMDDLGWNATNYRIFVSPYRMNQIKSNDPAVDKSKIIMRNFNGENVKEVELTVWTNEWLELDTAYYAFIVPISEYDEVLTPSKEVCFQLAKNICMLDTECDTFDLVLNPAVEPQPEVSEPEPTAEPEPADKEEETHGAACVWMNLAHVSHTVKGDKLTLTWTAVDWETVDIAIFNPDEEIYEKLATVKMKDEKYTYKMRWNGEQNFMLTNDCGELKYKADAAIKADEPEKIVTPATWPAENVLYIAIAAIVIYWAYTLFFRKSDN